jgi:hypothetical protein
MTRNLLLCVALLLALIGGIAVTPVAAQSDEALNRAGLVVVH